MIAMYSHIHAGGNLVSLQKLHQLGLSDTRVLVHSSAYQGQASVRPAERVSFATIPPRQELL